MYFLRIYASKKYLIVLLMNISMNVFSLNILFITGYFPHVSQFFIQNQIIQLIKNGHRVYIHSFKNPKYDTEDHDVYQYGLLQKTTYGQKLPSLSLFDILYVQFGYYGQKVVNQAKTQGFKGPIVVCFRGNDLSGYLQKDPHQYDQLFENIDLCLPVCSFFKDRLVELACVRSKIIVHHSAIPLDEFPLKQRKFNPSKKLKLISVARLVEKKGLDYAIKSVAVLIKRYPHVCYTIVGDTMSKEYKTYLKKLVIDLNLQRNVFFYGWATQQEVRTLLDEADLFILPSVTAADGDQEGIPNALKEAMAVGIPVIATDHAGNGELIDHQKTGLLIQEREYLEIVKAVNWYIKHPEKTAKMVKAARKKIETEFAIVPIVTKLENIFEQLIKQKRTVR